MPSTAKAAYSGYQTPAEEREAHENRSVALSQPHRLGKENPDDPRNGEPLWEACSRLKLRQEFYDAGDKYAQLSRAYKATLTIGVGNVGNGLGSTDEREREARDKLAKDRYWEAVHVMRRADLMAHPVLERVCYDLRSLAPHEDRTFLKGLTALAHHLRTIDRGINEGKAY